MNFESDVDSMMDRLYIGCGSLHRCFKSVTKLIFLGSTLEPEMYDPNYKPSGCC